jgi:hypothetical protein
MRKRPPISEQQVAALLRTPAEKRHQHFVSQAVGWRLIYMLRIKEEWMSIDRPPHGSVLPVWPDARYAEEFRQCRQIGNASVEAVSLEVWFKQMASVLGRRLMNVFPTSVDPGTLVRADELTQQFWEGLGMYGEGPEDFGLQQTSS